MSVSAQDDEAPEVVGPGDQPGADVVWPGNKVYELNATGSTDNVGIVLYNWTITWPDATITTIFSTTPTSSFTPTQYGIYKIVTAAYDAHGNVGYHLYTMDAYEEIPRQTIASTSVSYDHSVAVLDGSLIYNNVDIDVTGGLAAEGAAKVDAPDTMAESLSNKGKFAGHWEPYYYYYYWSSGNNYYGEPSEDTSTKIAGSKSIRISNGYYIRGIEYWFDQPVDLTGYEALSFWMHTDYSYSSSYIDYNRMYYVYFYGSTTYSTPYYYTFAGTYMQGGWSVYNGWHGYTVPLNYEKNGYTYMYGMSDLSSIQVLRFYFYTYSASYNRYSLWIDNVGFYNPSWGDEITESSNPTGDKAGYWSSSYGVATDYSESYVGSASVRAQVRYGSYNNIYYYFNNPQDLSEYNALRFMLNMKTQSGSQINYCYYWPYTSYYHLYVYDWSGNYAYYRAYRYTYTYYGYGYSYGGPWYAHSLPWGHDSAYRDYGVDWTNIRYFRFSNIYYSYSYPYTTYNYWFIDALEWYKPGGAVGGSGPPTNRESIPHGIYAMDKGSLQMNDVTFTSTSPFGAFIRSESDLKITSSTFDGLWGTTHPSIRNEGQTYGGILAFNSRVTLDNVVIQKASSSGFYLENCNLDATSLDLSGYSRDFPMSAGMIVAFRGTDVGDTHDVAITACDFHDSDSGSGLMILSQNARGDATVEIDDVYAYKNGLYGLVLEVVGWTGNMTLDVIKSEFELNTGSGFTFYAHNTLLTPRTQVEFNVEDSEAVENGEYGFLFAVEKSVINTAGYLTDVESYDNTGNGVGFDFNSFAGRVDLFFDEVYSHENLGNGMYIKNIGSNFRDASGNDQQYNGKLTIDMESCAFEGNERNGVHEAHGPSGTYNDALKATENYLIIGKNSTFEKNENHGYLVEPYGSPQYANHFAFWEFYNCLFSDNKNVGFYVYDYYYAYYYYGIRAQEHFYFEECTFTYNRRGMEQYVQSSSVQFESWHTIVGCTFQDNDYEAIMATGAWSSSYGGYGYSYMRTWEYDVQDSLLDGKVHLHLSGLYDYSQYKPEGKITMINNTYTSDEPMYLRIGAYYYSQSIPLEATVIYKDNKHTSPSTGDGLHIEMYGGMWLTGKVIVDNMDIYDALGNGIYVRFGTNYYSTSTKGVTGAVAMTNLDIRNPLEDGVHIETWHYAPGGSTSQGFYSLLDSRVSGAKTGVKSFDFSGEVRRCTFANIRQETIYTYFGVVDIFESEIGPISQQNLRVDEKGAIRLWFDLTVRVVWKTEPDKAVVGTSVEVKDNSWTILGVNTIKDIDGVLFSNLNSYTVLPEGIYTKNPYIVTADYIGIVKEAKVDLDESMGITIELVDDIAPRLTIESPKDGHEQRQETVMVKGTVYDKHTGVDRVEVTVNEVDWHAATMSSDKYTYTYELTDLPEGLVLISVRGYDIAGNVKKVSLSILVDSTPPSLSVITPDDGMKTNKRTLEIVGTTDVGANVYINDQPIKIRYTLISHQMILAEGPNAVKVSAVDYLGNIAEVIRIVTLDTQAPYIDIVNIEDGAKVNTKTITIEGQTDKEGVTLTVNGQSVKIREGTFEVDVELEEGMNDIEIYVKDDVGNDRLQMLTVYLDQTPPWLRLSQPSGDVLTKTTFTVAGYVEQGSRVFVNEREVEVSFGHFETRVSAAEGEFDLSISAIDEAGNELDMVYPLMVDTIPPALEIIYPTEGYVTNSPNLNVRGTIMGTEGEDMRYLELFINGIPRLFDYTTGEFSQEMLLEEGANRIIVTGYDEAGNDAELVRTVMLDSEAPYLSVFVGNTRIDPNWNEPVSLSDFVYVSGFTEIGAALTVNGVSVHVDEETGYFNYSLSLPSPPPGQKISTTDIVATSVDAAGNSITLTEKANRIEGVTTSDVDETTTAEWLILFLAIVIFGMALAGAYGYNRLQSQQEMIEAYESAPPRARVTPEGKVIAPPPARPARGGRARQKRPAPPEEEDEVEVVIHVDDEEEV